jgi:hypothetical protein
MLRSLRGNATQPETNPLREAAFFAPFFAGTGGGPRRSNLFCFRINESPKRFLIVQSLVFAFSRRIFFARIPVASLRPLG